MVGSLTLRAEPRRLARTCCLTPGCPVCPSLPRCPQCPPVSPLSPSAPQHPPMSSGDPQCPPCPPVPLCPPVSMSPSAPVPPGVPCPLVPPVSPGDPSALQCSLGNPKTTEPETGFTAGGKRAGGGRTGRGDLHLPQAASLQPACAGPAMPPAAPSLRPRAPKLPEACGPISSPARVGPASRTRGMGMGRAEQGGPGLPPGHSTVTQSPRAHTGALP